MDVDLLDAARRSRKGHWGLLRAYVWSLCGMVHMDTRHRIN